MFVQVIRRLRERGEPIRLFGESDYDAFQRLRKIEILTPEVNKVGVSVLWVGRIIQYRYAETSLSYLWEKKTPATSTLNEIHVTAILMHL